jgi:hypothetical protein
MEASCSEGCHRKPLYDSLQTETDDIPRDNYSMMHAFRLQSLIAAQDGLG